MLQTSLLSFIVLGQVDQVGLGWVWQVQVGLGWVWQGQVDVGWGRLGQVWTVVRFRLGQVKATTFVHFVCNKKCHYSGSKCKCLAYDQLQTSRAGEGQHTKIRLPFFIVQESFFIPLPLLLLLMLLYQKHESIIHSLCCILQYSLLFTFKKVHIQLTFVCFCHA